MILPRQVKQPIVKNCDPRRKTIPVIIKKPCDPGRNINLSIVDVLDGVNILLISSRGFSFHYFNFIFKGGVTFAI